MSSFSLYDNKNKIEIVPRFKNHIKRVQEIICLFVQFYHTIYGS